MRFGTLMVFTFTLVFWMTASAFAQEVGMSFPDFFASVLETLKGFGGLSFTAKVSAVLVLFVSSMKVTVLEVYWAKLGKAKIWVSLGLAFVAGLVDAFVGVDKFSWSVVFAYVLAGAGAPILHQVLDSVKAIPGLGKVYVGIINVVIELLGRFGTKKVQ
jgi:hypothetical protein